jgi:glycosyltransferase involved in cell wall biosynthesis
MTKVTHIIYILTGGGAARAMMSAAAHLRKFASYEHTIVSLLEPQANAVRIAEDAGMKVLHLPDRQQINQLISESDIVQLEWWNEPMLNEFLKEPMPTARVISWMHIAGNRDPQFITPEIIEFADIALASSPRSAICPAIKALDPQTRSRKVRMIYDCAEFDRVENVKAIPHDDFRIGYIGSVNPMKMHPDFVPMSAAINIPDMKVVVCGGDQQQRYAQQAAVLGAAEKFEFKGYVENIADEIARFDIYGYPLCEGTFDSAELNLQEIMYAGVPPVVFPHGGIGELIINDYTGLIVHTAEEYKQAIEFLYHNPEERSRLGNNAKEYAKQIFGAENAAKKFASLYEETLTLPKRERTWPQTASARVASAGLPAGTACFLESLGEEENIALFTESARTSTPDSTVAIDKQITQLSPLLKLVGIHTFNGYYEGDPFLTYWSALAHFGDNNIEPAIVSFSDALNLGFPDWRPLWFACLCLQVMGKQQELQNALSNLLQVAPGFQEALSLQQHLGQR